MENLVVLAPLLYLLIVAGKLVVVDLTQHRLPNRYTLPLIGLTYAALLLQAVSSGDFEGLLRSIVAGMVTFGAGYLLAFTAQFGMGDTKLLVSLNALLAWHSAWLVLISLAIGFTAASLVAIVVWRRTRNPKAAIALGPYLLIGFAITSWNPTYDLVTVAVWS